jgi:hypothetical protein
MNTHSISAPRSSVDGLGAAACTAPARRPCHGEQRDGDVARQREAAPRRHPLVAAMMQALSSLMPAKAPTAIDPAGATASTTPASTDAVPAPGLKEAAQAFAHELFDALRSPRDRRGGGEDGAHVHGHRSHHRHHGHVHGHGRGYGNLAHRLEALASEVASAAPPAAAPSETVTSLEPSAGEAAVPAKAESSLLTAFRQLYQALQPGAASEDGGAGTSDIADTLASFLRTLAQSLHGSQDDAMATAPAQGSLLSVTA